MSGTYSLVLGERRNLSPPTPIYIYIFPFTSSYSAFHAISEDFHNLPREYDLR